MTPKRTPSGFGLYRIRRMLLTLAILSLAFCFIDFRSDAQGQVQVTSAIPSLAEQGTTNLSVRVNGKGFKNGAQANWFVTGTADTGGVNVNSTTFVSSTEVIANITVADTAVIANFDIQVRNSDGRGGKGTELFKVIGKGANSTCPPMQPAPTSDTKCYASLPGCLDAAFGGIGYLHTDLDNQPKSVQANGVVVQPDGKVIVAGMAFGASTDLDFALIRYNIDGSLDTSFGDPDPFNPSLRRGYTVTAITSGYDFIRHPVLQPDGKIVVSGSANNVNSAVVRYNSDGTLDSTFGNGGIVILNFGKRVTTPNKQVAIQSDGKIAIGASVSSGFGVARLLPNGAPDTSFDSDGLAYLNPSGTSSGGATGWSIAIQRVPAVTGEERIVVAGWSRLSSSDNSDWTLVRFRGNGALDTSFGTNGIVKTQFYGFHDQARAVRIDSNNRIVVSGLVNTASTDCGGYITDFAVARYTENGNLDGSFAGGRQTVDIYGGGESLFALAVQTDNKVLILGTAASSDGAIHHFALVRFNADGTRDSSFGILGNGIVTTDLYGIENWGQAVAIAPSDGRIVAAGGGYFAPSTPGDIFVARYWP